MSLQFCAAPGCPVLVRKGRCVVHSLKKEQDRYNYDVRRWYRRAKWRRLRAQVLERDRYECRVCGQVTLDVDVDHIERHGGSEEKFYNINNLQVLCRSCHAVKTGRGE